MNFWNIVNFVFTKIPILNLADGYKRKIGFVALVAGALVGPAASAFGFTNPIPDSVSKQLVEWGTGLMAVGVVAANAKAKVG